ncbi:ATP-dependent 6-phosphofructokinase [Oceanibaculum pacificum]|uniref:ATP-dependent 6-phosphofructokinase n=1 Tax=Oceanibaculum pacificum TaxID=580166 RepID=A0A154VXS0_9PROT|nr:ATP-dependent 6-phosphofructokinase [Oceanibaculum pacificum]KZD05993.1 6-phosphofructokinase [Oceanibaculum pacificum]
MGKKRIGILTSGGDCAGLNACIRAATHHACQRGWEMVGIRYATAGLMRRPADAVTLTPDLLDSSFLRRAGTVLGSVNTGDPFAFPMPDGGRADRSAEVIEGYRSLGLDALIGIGGDGSLAILRRLAQQGGIDLVGVPKTIDNDVALTENAIGYATAVQVAIEALDRLQPTAASHDRVMVLEVMGRDAGHIALNAGISGGADVILIPEIDYRLEQVAQKVRDVRAGGRNFALLVVAESVRTPEGEAVTRSLSGQTRYGGIGQYLGDRLAELTGAETRVTVLGHVQRGAEAVPQDRLLASVYGAKAVDLIAEGRFDRMVAWQNRQVVDVPLAEIVDRSHRVDPAGPLVRTARQLGISFGD